MKKIFSFLIAIFCFLPLAFSEEKQLVDRVAAIVNQDVITQSELDMLFRPIYEQIVTSHKGPNLEGQIQDLRLKLLNQLIEDRLVSQEAEKLGIVVEDSELRE